MMIHDLLSVSRRAPSVSGAGLALMLAESSQLKASAPAPRAPPEQRTPSPSSTAFVASTDSGAKVALPTALAAYQEFDE